MRPVARRSALVLLATILLPTALLAQRDNDRDHRRGIRHIEDGRRGFWGVLSVGAGVERVDLDGDGLGYSDPLTRPVVGLRLGGTVNRHLRIGGEVNSWINERSDVTETVSALMLIAQYYPSARAGLFLKGGVGVGRSAVEFDDGFDVGDTGFAGVLGAGWDIRLGRRFALVPTVDLAQHGYAGDPGEGYKERIVTFGLGFALQH